MFEFRQDIDRKEILQGRSQRYLSKIIGLNELTLSQILSGVNTTQKTTAFAITKALNEDAEIEDYFIRKEK